MNEDIYKKQALVLDSSLGGEFLLSIYPSVWISSVDMPNINEELHDNDLLHYAIKHENIDLIRHLIKEGISLTNSKSPLSRAVKVGNLQIIKLLIDHGSDLVLETSDTFEINILHRALALRSDTKIIKLLIERGANINAQSLRGLTPLHLAVSWQNISIMKLLIQNGADVNCVDFKGNTPLMSAIEDSYDHRYAIMYFLLTHGAEVNYLNERKKTPLVSAIEHGDKSIVKLLLKFRANMNSSKGQKSEWSNPVTVAINYNHHKILRTLIKFGAELTKDQITVSLMLATKRNDMKLVRLLLHRKVQVDLNKRLYNGQTSLINAILNLNVPMIELLLEHGADINLKGSLIHKRIENCTPLYMASQYGNLEIMELCLKFGADVNQVSTINKKEMLAIHAAIQKEDIPAMKLLVDHGTKLDFCNLTGNTLLHYAVKMIAKQSVQFLLDAELDVNCMNNELKTPVQLAPSGNLHNIKNILLKHVVRLMSLGCYVRKQNLDVLSEDIENEENQKYRAMCEYEIDNMKQHICHHDSYITMYDFLRKPLDKATRVLRNDNVKSQLMEMDLDTLYPIYSAMLKWRVYMGIRRIKKLNVVYNILFALSNMSDDCILNVMNYLDEEDTNKLIQSVIMT